MSVVVQGTIYAFCGTEKCPADPDSLVAEIRVDRYFIESLARDLPTLDELADRMEGGSRWVSIADSPLYPTIKFRCEEVGVVEFIRSLDFPDKGERKYGAINLKLEPRSDIDAQKEIEGAWAEVAGE